ncbi:hypothetical protein [Nostoc sp.]
MSNRIDAVWSQVIYLGKLPATSEMLSRSVGDRTLEGDAAKRSSFACVSKQSSPLHHANAQ